jgi:hypothetical protein
VYKYCLTGSVLDKNKIQKFVLFFDDARVTLNRNIMAKYICHLQECMSLLAAVTLKSKHWATQS